jgi:AcrR family transcriptional regulator
MEPSNLHTKGRILFTALRLFSIHGYDNVSVRAVADAVGIKVASIYNHYNNKDEILEECYSFYTDHRYQNRLGKEQYEPIIKNGSKEEVMQALYYTFNKNIVEYMIMALLIIYSRLYTDKRAMNVFVSEISNSMQYLVEFFQAGIEIGRFNSFNVETVALIYLNSRMFTVLSVNMAPEHKVPWQEAEYSVVFELAKLLPFKF